MKLVNNLMFGIHLATAAEAIALGARAGLNVRKLFDIISTAAGNSWYNLWIHLVSNYLFLHLHSEVKSYWIFRDTIFSYCGHITLPFYDQGIL